MDRKYKKGGDAGSKGVRFQVSLLTLFLLKAITKLKNWKLSTENNVAGKFDDVVLEYPDEAVLLQAKHKDNKMTITFEDLLSTNSKKDDFSLPKYFLSYQEIKNRFKVKNVIVCTNANFDKKTTTFMKSTKVSPDSMLYYEIDNCLVYTFNDNILPELKNNTKIYLKDCRNKKIEESVINDENLKDFLDHLHFYFNYPSGRDIESIIERQLSAMRDLSNFYDEATSTDIHSKMMDWFQQKDGEYLTEVHANAMFSEIKRDKYWQKLERYDVFFQHNDLKFDSPTKIFHIVDDERSLLREIQVYRALQGIKTVLCVPPESDVKELKEILKAFELPKYTLLTIVWSKCLEKSLIVEITTKLEQILNHKHYKKVILVTKNNSDLITQFQLRNLSHQIIHHSIIFDDLLEETQKNILKKRIINFQGNTFNLKELLALETVKEYGAAMNCEILEKLVRNEEVIVGRRVQPLDLDVEYLYINRTLLRNDEQIEEENVFEINEKVILIADGPGMGKSTILTNLAIAIKKKHPHLWIIKIVLSDYTRILNTLLAQNTKTLDIFELMNSQVETQLTHQLEKFLFSMKNRVVLMLDGVDEISPNYIELVENLIVHCQQAPNFLKVIVTTRPHVTEQLENKLKLESVKLQSFTRQNQIEFLTNYWTHHLNDKNKAKYERYAELLLDQMRLSKKWYYMGDSHFASIPLQIRMLAEIFQEYKEEEPLESSPSLIKINCSKLFTMFIEKKRSVYLDKLNPSKNAMANLSINKQFDECLEYHRAYALEIILDKEKRELFTNYKEGKIVESELFNIGILQKTDNNIHFIHRTFAEYFVAECLVRELQCRNRNVNFQKFLIDEILQKYDYLVVRVFFDSFLQDGLDSLPSDTFKEYRSITYKVNAHPLSLMHYLAGAGYVGILQLILKSIDFGGIKPVNCKEFAPFRNTKNYNVFGRLKNIYRSHKYRNALSVLRFCVRHGGVNVRDRNEETPLDRAIDTGHLDMVKYLVEQGSNINSNKPPKQAFDVPLYRAVERGYFDIVKFLVEQGANIKPNKKWDYRILYEAVSGDYVGIAEYLLEKILESDDSALKDYFVPYTAAYLGQMDILEPLLKENPTVHHKIPNGETLLFAAARGGQLDIIRYLVDHGANINSKNNEGNTALHMISKNPSRISTAKLLIELGIDINIADFNKKETALHVAAASGNLEAVQLFIENGADVNVKNVDGINAVYFAVERGHLTVLKLLIEKGANILSGYQALRIAIQNYKVHVVRFLLEFGIDVTIKHGDEYPLLHCAVKSDRLDAVQLLIKFGIDLNGTDKYGNTALHVAVDKDYVLARINMNIIKCLVDSGVNVNVRNWNGHTALHVLLNTSKSACLWLVEKLDVDDFDGGLEAMSEAVMVERWNAKDYEMHDVYNWVLPMFATSLATIIFLIKRGTDISLEDSNGITTASLMQEKGGQLLMKCLGLKLSELKSKRRSSSFTLKKI